MVQKEFKKEFEGIAEGVKGYYKCSGLMSLKTEFKMMIADYEYFPKGLYMIIHLNLSWGTKKLFVYHKPTKGGEYNLHQCVDIFKDKYGFRFWYEENDDPESPKYADDFVPYGFIL